MFVPWDQKREKLARQVVDKAPLPHFLKHDQRNLTAANARLAELRREEERKLVTPPEELPSWKWFDPRRRVVDRCLTNELLGDPGASRSALGGWMPRGDRREGDVEFESERAVPSMPSCAGLSPFHGWKLELSAAARAVLTRRGCRFPIGEVFSDEFHFCNARRRHGSSYCPQHAQFCEKQL